MNRKNMFPIALITVIVLPLFAAGFIGVVSAPPFPIGDAGYTQANPFDSNPTSGGFSGIGTPTGAIDMVWDGSLDTNINYVYGSSDRGFLNVTGFKKPSDNGLTDFAITFIDIKVDYRVACAASGMPDEVRVVFYFGGNTYELTPWTQATKANWTGSLQGALHGIRTFSNVARPGGGAWTWSDIATLKVGVETRVVATSDFQRLYVHEIWITAYSSPYPASNAMSIQPSAVVGLHSGDTFYVDVYVTNVANMWGYELMVNFSSDFLTAIEFVSYGPFVTGLPSEIGPDYVAVSSSTFNGDPNGFTGNTPVARIYFGVIADGLSLLKLAKWSAADAFGKDIILTPKDGVFASNPVHEVAIIDVVVSNTSVVPGVFLEVNVTVMNQGTFLETFDVKAFNDTTAFDTQIVTDLAPGLDQIVTFEWNTTGVTLGFHQIKAEITVPIDVNPNNNVMVWDVVPEGVLVGIHDIAVTNIVRAYANDTVVPPGELLNVTRVDIVHINVTVQNFGNFSETFNLTLMWTNKYRIENKTNIQLDPGASTILTFIWDTDFTSPEWAFPLDRWGRPTNFTRGNIRAVATPVWNLAGDISAGGVPYEKGLDYNNVGNNDVTDGEVGITRDLLAPTAFFNAAPLDAYATQPITFTSYSVTPEGTTLTSYRWDFGDGNITETSSTSITHAYSAAGSYYASLFVFNNLGKRGRVSMPYPGAPERSALISVRNVKVVSVDVSPTTVVIGQNATISVTLKNEGEDDEDLVTSGKKLTIYFGNTLAVKVNAPSLGAMGTATGTKTVSINWNTTGFMPGVNSVKAVLDDLPYETSFTDNTVIFATQVTLQWHNIKITNIAPAKTEASIGESVTVSVTVLNQGNFTETFTITAYVNNTAIGSAQTVTGLAAGASKVVDFTWDTSGLDSGVYVFRAEASSVTLEAVTSDNTFAGGSVTLSPPSNTLIYIIIGAVVVIAVVAAVGVYFLKFRKPKQKP